MRAWLLLLAACGRVGFGEHPSDASAGSEDGAVDDGVAIDAVGCVDADGQCPMGCTGADTDCAAVCGDSICSGNVGESCVDCAGDCNTMTPICGNSICDAGEDGATCLVDCGPTPWPYAQLEADFLAAMNTARTTGVICSGDTAPTIAPAATIDPADPTVIRRLAYAIALQNTITPTMTCNGTTFSSLINMAGYGRADYGVGYQSAQEAVDGFTMSTNGTCPVIMDPARSTIMIGAVVDGFNAGWVVVLR